MRFLLLLLLASPAAATDIFDVRVQKVADGVYVASRAEPLRPYVEGNVTFIINEHDVVAVDAGGSSKIARNIIAEIRKLTPNPVSTLVCAGEGGPGRRRPLPVRAGDGRRRSGGALLLSGELREARRRGSEESEGHGTTPLRRFRRSSHRIHRFPPFLDR